MKYRIQHPEWITVSFQGKPFYGYDQEWYGQYRQKLAGCGPTTASVLAAYLDKKEWHIDTPGQKSALALMETMWQYVPPRMRGLYKTRWFRDGFCAYMEEHSLLGRVDILRVRPFHWRTPSPETAGNFIAEGIRADCPVAFLNRHDGGEPALSTWHWVPVTAVESRDGDWLCTIWDEGHAGVFSLSNWLKRTRFGGGFVRVTGTKDLVKL